MTQEKCAIIQYSSCQAVLRANQGAVHETIDQLLTMTTDTEGQGSDCPTGGGGQLVPHGGVGGGGGGGGGASNELPPSYALSATPPPSYHQAVPSPNRSPLYVSLVCSIFIFFLAAKYRALKAMVSHLCGYYRE